MIGASIAVALVTIGPVGIYLTAADIANQRYEPEPDMAKASERTHSRLTAGKSKSMLHPPADNRGQQNAERARLSKFILNTPDLLHECFANEGYDTGW